MPLAIVDLSSTQMSPNDAFALLLGLDETERQATPCLSDLVFPEDWPVVQAVLAGAASGLIESCQGRGRLRPPRGGELDVVAWVRPFDGARPCPRAVLAVVPAGELQPLANPWFARVDAKRVAFGSLDHDWRFVEISPDAASLLGWDLDDYRGAPVQRAVHPDDVALLLLTLGRSGQEHSAIATRLRVRGPDGGWTPVRCAVSPLCDHDPARFGFGLWLYSKTDELDAASERTAELEGHLWRIAAELQSANITNLPKSSKAWWADPALQGLSERQSQVLRRLIRGERVRVIAGGLFLSESTVRNHLSAIYRKVGVHSQSELLARAMGSAEA
ncbi:MAG: hypothetical protein QOJ67_2733 [Acidimicrobiaceae bacterium]